MPDTIGMALVARLLRWPDTFILSFCVAKTEKVGRGVAAVKGTCLTEIL